MDISTNDNLRSKESEKSIMQNIILKGIVMEQYDSTDNVIVLTKNQKRIVLDYQVKNSMISKQHIKHITGAEK